MRSLEISDTFDESGQLKPVDLFAFPVGQANRAGFRPATARPASCREEFDGKVGDCTSETLGNS